MPGSPKDVPLSPLETMGIGQCLERGEFEITGDTRGGYSVQCSEAKPHSDGAWRGFASKAEAQRAVDDFIQHARWISAVVTKVKRVRDHKHPCDCTDCWSIKLGDWC